MDFSFTLQLIQAIAASICIPRLAGQFVLHPKHPFILRYKRFDAEGYQKPRNKAMCCSASRLMRPSGWCIYRRLSPESS